MSHLLRVLITSPTLGLEDIFTEEAGYLPIIYRHNYAPMPSMDELDMLVFSGGDDIDPALYNHKRSTATQQKSYRDEIEVELATKGHFAGIPMVGVCRGAQLLCAIYGGALYQDIPDHEGPEHLMITRFDNKIPVSSAHHQACIINDDNMQLMGWSDKRVQWAAIEDKAPLIQPIHITEEFTIRGGAATHFCAQYHPEWGPDPCTYHFMSQVKSFIKPQAFNRRQALEAKGVVI